MLIAINSVLSQLKWRWFEEKPRPLEHLDAYDAASRGPWSSLRLIYVIARPYVAIQVLSLPKLT
jgi:hypothetical protein